MSGHIENAFIYAAATGAFGLGLVSLGKAAQFLKCNGSVVATGLLTGCATAAAIPLTKKGFVYLPPQIYQHKLTRNQDREKVDSFLKAAGCGALSLIVTSVLVNRLTFFISGYHLSIPKKLGLALLSAGVSFGGYALIQSLIEQGKFEEFLPGNSIIQSLDQRQQDRFFNQVLAAARETHGEINEITVAETLSQLDTRQFTRALSYFNDQPAWTHFSGLDTIVLSPYMILAHVRDPQKRQGIFEQHYTLRGTVLGALEDKTLRQLYNNVLKCKVDAETLALCFSLCTENREEYLQAMERSELFQGIPRDAVEAHMPLPLDEHEALGLIARALESAQLEPHIAFGHLVQTLHRKGVSSPCAYAKILERVSDDAIIISYLNFINQQPRYICFSDQDYAVQLDPFMILAHFKDLDQRARLFSQCEFTAAPLQALTNSKHSLEEYTAEARIREFNSILQRVNNVKIYAMFFDQIQDEELQTALLNAFEGEPGFVDAMERIITREEILANMKTSATQSQEELTKKDAITAGITGLGTLAVTSAALTTMILTSRLAHWTWSSYPTLRGVFPAALMASVGFGIGELGTKNRRVGYIAAFVLGTIASPKVSKLISTHEMSYWHGGGFSTLGILGFMFMAAKSGRQLQYHQRHY